MGESHSVSGEDSIERGLISLKRAAVVAVVASIAVAAVPEETVRAVGAVKALGALEAWSGLAYKLPFRGVSTS
jgi:radical SAM superfamily enzyme with C-terminal helix-hairpin-helix motif